jgi:hypothetical protein
VLTGGPGCGKSYTVRAIVNLARAKRAKILLAAPTGRAAKRLAELAGMEAATLHRLLQLRPGGDAAVDRDRPLDADLMVVDEASMLDVLLANKLGACRDRVRFRRVQQAQRFSIDVDITSIQSEPPSSPVLCLPCRSEHAIRTRRRRFLPRAR